jgi:hypothetical protein
VAAPQALEEVLDGPICRGIVLAIQTTVQFELPEIAEEVHTAGMCLFEFAHVVLQVLWVYLERRAAFVDLVVVGAFAQVGLFDQQVLHRLYKIYTAIQSQCRKGCDRICLGVSRYYGSSSSMPDSKSRSWDCSEREKTLIPKDTAEDNFFFRLRIFDIIFS